MIWNPTKFKSLGIWFTQDLEDCDIINYNDKYREVKTLFRIWAQRTITPTGRVAILKSLVLSKLVHLWILLPDPPDLFIQKLQMMCFKFVWNGKQNKINRNTSIKSIKHGGLSIPDVRKYIYALKLSWVRKVNTTKHKWKSIVIEQYPFLENLERYGPLFLNNYLNSNPFWPTHLERIVILTHFGPTHLERIGHSITV